MNNIILAQNDKPFKTAGMAKKEQKKLKLERKTKIVEHEGGWALEKGNGSPLPVSKAKTLKDLAKAKGQETPKRSNRPANRPKRQPLASRDILTAPKRPGFVRRFVNDIDERVQTFEEAGYEIVREPTKVGDKRAGTETQLGSPVRKAVGGGVGAVLMEIPEEYYEEDQEAKEAKRRDMEESMKQQARQEGHYGEIKIEKRQ